jgi:hypothetical protein
MTVAFAIWLLLISTLAWLGQLLTWGATGLGSCALACLHFIQGGWYRGLGVVRITTQDTLAETGSGFFACSIISQ